MRITAIHPLGSQVYAVTQDATPGCLPETMTVNLRALGWNGSCTCRAFTEYCAYMLRHSKARQRCDHILAARQWFMEHEAPLMVETAAEENIVVMPDYETATADTGL